MQKACKADLLNIFIKKTLSGVGNGKSFFFVRF